jgi:hypothetical protein
VIALSYTISQANILLQKGWRVDSHFVNRTPRRHIMQTQDFTLRSPNLLAAIQSEYTKDQPAREATEQDFKRTDEVSKYTLPEDSEPFQGTDYAGPGFRQERYYSA